MRPSQAPSGHLSRGRVQWSSLRLAVAMRVMRVAGVVRRFTLAAGNVHSEQTATPLYLLLSAMPKRHAHRRRPVVDRATLPEPVLAVTRCISRMQRRAVGAARNGQRRADHCSVVTMRRVSCRPVALARVRVRAILDPPGVAVPRASPIAARGAASAIALRGRIRDFYSILRRKPRFCYL